MISMQRAVYSQTTAHQPNHPIFTPMRTISAGLFRTTTAAAILWGLIPATSSHAQLDVKINTPQGEFVAYESIPVGVAVTNRSGRDIVLAAPEGQDWLEFRVFRGNLAVQRVAAPGTFESTILKAGQTITKTLDLSTFYSMSAYGFYTYQANVYFSPARTWISSNRESARVVGARDLWTETFGTQRDRPADEEQLSQFELLNDPGGSRVMTLRTHKMMKYLGNDKSYLYYQLEDPNTQTVHTCYRLGELIDLRPPRFGIDSENHAHALFMIRPQLYAKIEIDTKGNVIESLSKFYREHNNSIPTLQAAPNGGIVVTGGREYDPEKTREIRRSMRRLSDLPQGLIDLKSNAALGN